LLDPRDLAELGLHAGDRIKLTSPSGSLEGVAGSGPCRRGHVQGFWPECNALLGRKYDPASGEPDYSTSVRIERLP
jgi:hypothetical protein